MTMEMIRCTYCSKYIKAANMRFHEKTKKHKELEMIFNNNPIVSIGLSEYLCDDCYNEAELYIKFSPVTNSFITVVKTHQVVSYYHKNIKDLINFIYNTELTYMTIHIAYTQDNTTKDSLMTSVNENDWKDKLKTFCDLLKSNTVNIYKNRKLSNGDELIIKLLEQGNILRLTENDIRTVKSFEPMF